MERENLDIGQITEARQNAIKRSLHIVGIEELKSLGETLFPFHDNPWRDVFFQYIKENSGNIFYRATTHDGIEIIYCHAKENGMWFMGKNGVGPLQTEGIRILKKTVEEMKAR